MASVLYLDRYHLGDPLFLNGLSRDVLASPEPLVLVHGAGEAAERALEAQGRIPEWREGVLAVESESDRALVERAARDLNRRIAHALNEAGVAAVRLDAGSRGLFRVESGALAVKNRDWLAPLVAQRVVPVLAALLEGGDSTAREVSGGEVAGRLALALGEMGSTTRVLMLTKNASYTSETAIRSHGVVPLDAVEEGALPEPEAVRAALVTGAEVRLVPRTALRQAHAEGGVIVTGVDNKSA